MALLHVNYHSAVLRMDTAFSVIMPETMQGIGLAGAKERQHYPVLWLLHGRSDDHTIWMRRTSIERYAAPYGIMVIMPEVSYSRYLNMKHGPAYYDFAARELPEVCAALFPRMSRAREDNFIAGLSMGGGGAMWIGLHNPDRYGGICMLSTGGIAPLEHLWRGQDNGSSAYRKTNLDVYGTEDSDSLAGTDYDILRLIRETAEKSPVLPRVYHAMGTEDVRYPVAMTIKDTFLSIPGNPYRYEYHEGPGKHEWEFWDTWIRRYLGTLQL